MDILNRQERFNVDMTHREDVLTKLAKEIESRSKRQKATVHDYKKYEISRRQLTEDLKNLKHFDESDFPDCHQFVTEKAKASKVTELDDVSSCDSDFENGRDSRSDRKMSSRKFEDARDERSRHDKRRDLK